MKKLISISIFALSLSALSAQDQQLIDRIYEHYPGEKMSIALNLDMGLFKDFDIDINTEAFEQQLEGTVRRMRLIQFENYREALRSEKQIIEDLMAHEYELVPSPEDWHKGDSQLLIFRKKQQRRSPHLILIHNDRGAREARLIILSGSIIYNMRNYES